MAALAVSAILIPPSRLMRGVAAALGGDGRLSFLVVGLVVASAVLHLGWNLGVRRHPGSLKFVWIMTLAGGTAAAIVAFLLRDPVPWTTVWPYIVGTVVAHGVYFSGLAESYRGGAIGDVYPATRGVGIVVPGYWAGSFCTRCCRLSPSWASV